MSLFRKWGFGAELVFDAGKATMNMTKAQRGVKALKGAFGGLREAGSRLGGSITTLGTLLAPLGIGFGLAAAKASSLAGNLEAQKLTMRVMIGDLGKANDLLGMIRKNAAATPFTEGDLIEGSKRLLRLTGDNIDKNMDLLKMMETMAALSPGKSVVDAVEGLLDATSGGGFERLKEFGFALRAEDFKAAGRPGGQAWAEAVVESMRKTLDEKTRGEDLVGALARTFGGRLSTLQDAVENILKGIGEPLNEAIGPAVVAITELINTSADDLVAGFRDALSFMSAAWDQVGAPIWQAFLEAWKAIGVRGRQVTGLMMGLFGSFTSAILPVGGAIGVLVIALGAIASGLSAIAPLVTGIAGLLAAPEALVIAAAIGLIALGIAELAAGAAALAAIVGMLTARSGSLGAVWAGLDTVMDGARVRFDLLRQASSEFMSGFLDAAGPLITTMLDDLQPAFDAVLELVGDLLGEMGFLGIQADGVTSIALALGQAFGESLAQGIETTTFALRTFLELVRLVLPMFTQLVVGFRRLFTLFVGFRAGTMSARDGMQLLFLTMQQGILTTLQTFGGAMFRTIQRVLAALAELVGNVPGLGRILGGGLGKAGIAVGKVGERLEANLGRQIGAVDARARALEGLRAEQATTTVNVAPETTVETTVNAELCVDGQEVARATGAAAVRAGERGTGPALPAQQRGRVLRRGLVVEPLRPAEAF